MLIYKNECITAVSRINNAVFDLDYYLELQYIDIDDQSDDSRAKVSVEVVMNAKPGTDARGRLIEHLCDRLYINGITADNLVSDLFDLVSK
ncbi:hypothetical protein [Yersinia phage MHG19]|nr:hypothetical protein [Yersinia phage MHG19]